MLSDIDCSPRIFAGITFSMPLDPSSRPCIQNVLPASALPAGYTASPASLLTAPLLAVRFRSLITGYRSAGIHPHRPADVQGFGAADGPERSR